MTGPSSPEYPAEQTALSRQVLRETAALVPGAVLIGGWGTWVRLGGPLSHDIDLIVSHDDLRAVEQWADSFSDNPRLAGRKWQAVKRGISVDLYVPYQSVIGGRLQLRAEKLIRHAEKIEGGWHVLTVDAHLTTKLAALLGRPYAMPGYKDRGEIRRLLRAGGQGVPAVLLDVSPQSAQELAALMDEAFSRYLTTTDDVKREERAWLRGIRAEWLAALAQESEG